MAKTPQHVNPRHMYTMFNSTLKEEIGEKDLGVTFDSELNFRQHIKDIISKANSRVGIIQRTFTKLTKHNFLILIQVPGTSSFGILSPNMGSYV